MGMISSIVDFFRGLIRNKNIAQSMQTTFKLPEDMLGMIEVWKGLYMGIQTVPGEKDECCGIVSMICNDLTKKAMGELKIGVGYKGSSEFDIGLFDNEDMITLREQVEYAIALGGVVMRPVVRGGRVVEEWYTPDRIIPTDWDKRTMTGVTLVDYFVQMENNTPVTYVKLESHGYSNVDGLYHIRTKAFKDFSFTHSATGVGGGTGWVGKEVPLAVVPDWADITPDIVIVNATVPTFVYIGTPFANNKVFNQPMGVSIFKDSIPWVYEFERAFTSARYENRHGRSKAFVASTMIPQKLLKSIDGSKGIYIDDLSELDKEFYRKLETESAADLFEQWAPNLRFENYENYMNFLLHMICLTAGLDPGQYVFDEASYAVTAKEIISKQQKTYSTIVDLQRYMITPAIHHIIDCTRQLQYLYDLPAIPEGINVAVDYGDSILIDEEQERQNAMLEVQSKLRSRKDYLLTQRGLTEEEAEAELRRIDEENKVDVPDYFQIGQFGA